MTIETAVYFAAMVPVEKDQKMTAIEQGYVTQGYIIPVRMTWEQVAEARAKWNIDAIYVPVVSSAGCVGWGVPMRDGKFLTHP